jgi:hypothetical protein
MYLLTLAADPAPESPASEATTAAPLDKTKDEKKKRRAGLRSMVILVIERQSFQQTNKRLICAGTTEKSCLRSFRCGQAIFALVSFRNGQSMVSTTIKYYSTGRTKLIENCTAHR